jgi:hypothetical protein
LHLLCVTARTVPLDGHGFASPLQVVDFIARVSEPKKAVDMLAAEASARWMKEEQVIDDTTIIVAYL